VNVDQSRPDNMVGRLPAGRWTLSTASSSLGFRIRKFWWHPTGRFREIEGLLDTTEDGRLRVTGRARVASVATGIPLRDHHLRTRHFFDEQSHPWITFDFLDAEPVGEDRSRLSGDLKIKGRTGRVELTAHFDVQGDRVAVHGEGRIDREDFGVVAPFYVEMGGLMLGREVELRLDAVFDREPEREASPAEALYTGEPARPVDTTASGT
jgi:polyisoprenoid-binding protein YceI